MVHSSPRFHAEPSGTYTRYQAKAIGSGSEGAQTSLQEQYRKDMTLKEAEAAALSILKQVMEEKVRSSRKARGTSPLTEEGKHGYQPGLDDPLQVILFMVLL